MQYACLSELLLQVDLKEECEEFIKIQTKLYRVIGFSKGLFVPLGVVDLPKFHDWKA